MFSYFSKFSNQVAENVIAVHPFFEERVYLHSFKMYLQVECACLPLVNANVFHQASRREDNVVRLRESNIGGVRDGRFVEDDSTCLDEVD